MTNEYEVYEFLKGKISDVLLPNEQILDNPDESFSVIDDNNNSTPVVVLELIDTVSGQRAFNGRMISGETSYNIGIFVAKINRPFSVYKQEIISLIGRIRSALDLSDQRVVWESVEFGDFSLENINVSSALISISVPIGNYSYEIK